MAVDLFTRFLQESAGAVQDVRDAYRLPLIELSRLGNMNAVFDRARPLAQGAPSTVSIIGVGPFMSWLRNSSEGGSSEPGSAAEAQAQAQMSQSQPRSAASSPTPPPGMTAAQFELARMVNAVQGNTRALGPQADAAFTNRNQRAARQPQQQYQPVANPLTRISDHMPQLLNEALNEAAAAQEQAPQQGDDVSQMARMWERVTGIKRRRADDQEDSTNRNQREARQSQQQNPPVVNPLTRTSDRLQQEFDALLNLVQITGNDPQAAEDFLRGLAGLPRRDSGAATNAPAPVGGTSTTGGVVPNAATNDLGWLIYLNSLSNQQLYDMYRNPEAAASLLLEMSNIPRNSGLGEEFVRRAVQNQVSFEQRNANPLEFAQYLWNDLQYLRSTGEQGIRDARNLRRQHITQLRDEFLDPESPNALHLRELELSIDDPDRAESAIWSTFIAPYYGSDVTNSAARAARSQFERMWEEYNAAVIAGRYNKGEFGKYLVDNGFLLFRELEGER